MDKILKGNYTVSDLDKKVRTPHGDSGSLTEDFQVAASKKLGGSITFVKKPVKSDGSGLFIFNPQ